MAVHQPIKEERQASKARCYGRFKYDVITTWGRVAGS